MGILKKKRVPVIMQMEALECGAACLTMVLASYGKWVPLEKVRFDCGVSRDGSNALNMLKAARTYGLTAAGYRYEPEELRTDGRFPCIIHWNLNHFVVLKGFRGSFALINDPARGECKVPMEVFDKSFTGVCLEFSPGESFVADGRPKSILSFAKKRLKGTGGAVFLVTLMTVASALFGIINPVLSRVFLDRILPGNEPDLTRPFLILLALTGIAQILAAFLNAVTSLRINGKLGAVGSSSYLWKLLHMPVEFFSQRMAGDLRQRQAANASVASSFVNLFSPLLINVVMMIVYFTVMIRYDLLLTIIGVSSIVINLLVANLISVKRINISRVMLRDAGTLAGRTGAGIEMIETIKASGAENGYFEHWSASQAAVNTQQVRYEKLDQHLGLVPSLLSAVTGTAVTILGLINVIRGSFTPGMILAFQGFLTGFTAPALTIIGTGRSIQEMRSQMERIEDVMEYPEDPAFDKKDGEDADLRKLSGDLELKNVTFGYSRLGEPLIRDFSMKVPRGGRVALVGGSGCGKSTIVKLIAGLYRPWSGEVLFDGKSSDGICREVFTSSVAVADQDTILFEGTVSDNIKLWDRSIEDFEMILAARDASIHEDLMQREGGYEARLCEGGKNLSGGQRQRLEIARVLSGDPTIVILDEATSALDAKTEFEVMNAIRDRGVTCIVAAHRLSAIRDCDEIIVLDHGVVKERGTHEELIGKGGLYAGLVTSETI